MYVNISVLEFADLPHFGQDDCADHLGSIAFVNQGLLLML